MAFLETLIFHFDRDLGSAEFHECILLSVTEHFFETGGVFQFSLGSSSCNDKDSFPIRKNKMLFSFCSCCCSLISQVTYFSF